MLRGSVAGCVRSRRRSRQTTRGSCMTRATALRSRGRRPRAGFNIAHAQVGAQSKEKFVRSRFQSWFEQPWSVRSQSRGAVLHSPGRSLRSWSSPGPVLAQSWSAPIEPWSALVRPWSVLVGPGRPGRSRPFTPYGPGGHLVILVRPRSVLVGPGLQSLRSFAVLGLVSSVGPLQVQASLCCGRSLVGVVAASTKKMPGQPRQSATGSRSSAVTVAQFLASKSRPEKKEKRNLCDVGVPWAPASHGRVCPIPLFVS